MIPSHGFKQFTPMCKVARTLVCSWCTAVGNTYRVDVLSVRLTGSLLRQLIRGGGGLRVHFFYIS